MFRGKPGDCLLIETNKEAGHIRSHPFVIILEGEAHTRNTIIVNIQSVPNGKYDSTVVLKRGDHEFIEHDSYVNYRLARIVSLDEIEKKIEQGTAIVKPSFTNEIFRLICDGICKSRFTPAEVVEMYQNSLFSKI